MASESSTRRDVQTGVNVDSWQAGLAGGLVGGVAFGIMMTVQLPMILENAIPGMYGLGPVPLRSGGRSTSSTLRFSGSCSAFYSPLAGSATGSIPLVAIAVAGLAYGVVLWLVLASFVMPAWVGAMTEMAPPVPDWNVDSLLGHAVYGVLLGIVYAVLSR